MSVALSGDVLMRMVHDWRRSTCHPPEVSVGAGVVLGWRLSVTAAVIGWGREKGLLRLCPAVTAPSMVYHNTEVVPGGALFWALEL